MKPSDHYKMVLHELTSVGIKPLVEKTGSGHLRIAWSVDGANDFIICASTPSDHRSSLNERARIRRKLRPTGIYDRVKVKPLPLTKALEVPAGVDPLPLRVEQLETDIGIMLELLSEAKETIAKEAFAAGWNGHAVAVERALSAVRYPGQEPFAKPTASVERISTPRAPAPPKPPRAMTKQQRTMAKMHYDAWLSVTEIAKETGFKKHHVSVMLWGLRKKHLVDNANMKWRLLAPKAVPDAVAVPAPRLNGAGNAYLQNGA